MTSNNIKEQEEFFEKYLKEKLIPPAEREKFFFNTLQIRNDRTDD